MGEFLLVVGQLCYTALQIIYDVYRGKGEAARKSRFFLGLPPSPHTGDYDSYTRSHNSYVWGQGEAE